jgi:hypothetical protein
MRKLIILAIAAALAALTCVPAAMAAKTKTTVKLTSAFLGNGQSFWDGTIKSSKKACANKRPVTVYTGAGKKIGTVKSQKVTGVGGYQWTLAARIAIKPGKRYYAKVKATPSCRGAKSNVYTFTNAPQQLPTAPAPPSANGGS